MKAASTQNKTTHVLLTASLLGVAGIAAARYYFGGRTNNSLYTHIFDVITNFSIQYRKKRKLTAELWFKSIDDDGKIINPEAMRKLIIEGGMSSCCREEVLPFLLNMRSPTDSAVEQMQAKRERKRKYQALRKRCEELEKLMKGKGKVFSKETLAPRDLGVFTEAHAVIKADAPRTRFIRGEYANTYSGDLGWENSQVKRLRRLLEAFALQDPVIGYVQGLNDIAAGFLHHCIDESEAFWCFANFISGSFRAHFVISGIAVDGQANEGGISERLSALSRILQMCDKPLWKHLQLLKSENCMFAFRLVVVLMSRDLSADATEYLWDVLMATRDFAPTSEATAVAAAAAVVQDNRTFHLNSDSDIAEVFSVGGGRLFLHIVTAAVLEMRNDIWSCKNYDDLLKLCNSMSSKKMNISKLLIKARFMLQKTRGAGEAKIQQKMVL